MRYRSIGFDLWSGEHGALLSALALFSLVVVGSYLGCLGAYLGCLGAPEPLAATLHTLSEKLLINIRILHSGSKTS